MTPRFAITPCPNDVFSYFYWMKQNSSRPQSVPFEFVFDDIETLNRAALRGEFEITKMSFAAYLKNRDRYELLNAGAALGLGTGPVLVAASGADFASAAVKDENFEVLIPGADTTAALLFKFFYRGKNAVLKSAYFRDILQAMQGGRARFGVLIHEGRFVYQESGLNLVKDLGEYWTQITALPVPLGCICVRKDFAHEKTRIEAAVREGIAYAFKNESAVLPTVAAYAQYLEADVLKKHIYAFVNEYSFDISKIREKLLSSLEAVYDAR